LAAKALTVTEAIPLFPSPASDAMPLKVIGLVVTCWRLLWLVMFRLGGKASPPLPLQQLYLESVTKMVSTNQPVLPLLSSLPNRHRNWMLLPAAAAGRLTTTVTKPPELPLQPSVRPADSPS